MSNACYRLLPVGPPAVDRTRPANDVRFLQAYDKLCAPGTSSGCPSKSVCPLENTTCTSGCQATYCSKPFILGGAYQPPPVPTGAHCSADPDAAGCCGGVPVSCSNFNFFGRCHDLGVATNACLLIHPDATCDPKGSLAGRACPCDGGRAPATPVQEYRLDVAARTLQPTSFFFSATPPETMIALGGGFSKTGGCRRERRSQRRHHLREFDARVAREVAARKRASLTKVRRDTARCLDGLVSLAKGPRVPWNRVWVGPTLFLLAACSSTSKIRGLDDAGADGQGGSAGNAQGGSSGSGSGGSAGGNAGTGALGAGGSAGSNAGNGGSSGSDAGSGGSGAAGSAGSGSSGGTSGGAGTGGTSGCTLEEATVDFAAQGNVTRMRFDQRGVAVIGIADLKLSDHSAAEPDAGLGVVGGWFDWSIDTTEFVTFSFTRPAANVKILVTHALDINKDDVYGKSTVTGYDANGQQIDHFEIAGPGEKNLSALFGGVTLSKVMIKSDADGIAIGTLTFVACLD